MSPNHYCGCERGDNCTKTTMCYVQNVEQDLRDELETLSVAVRDANAAFEESDTACADLEDENKRLSAENSHYRAALGFVADLAAQSGAINKEMEIVSTVSAAAEKGLQIALDNASKATVSTGQDGSQNGNTPMPPPWCTKCGAMTDVECDCRDTINEH